MQFHLCSIFDVSELECPHKEDYILVCPSCWERLAGYAIISTENVASDVQCNICKRTAGEIPDAEGRVLPFKQKR